MKPSRLFRWIWRINGIAILLVAIAALMGIAALVIDQIGDSRRSAARVAAAPVVKDAGTEARFRLGAPQPIPGTMLLRANLLRDAGRESSLSGSYKSGQTHNLLFIDTESGHCRWLLPSHRRVIDEIQEIHHHDDSAMTRAPAAVLALVKERDAAAGDLLVFDATGTTITTAASGVRALHSAVTAGSSHVNVVFERQGNYVLARYAIPALTKVSEMPLRVPQLP